MKASLPSNKKAPAALEIALQQRTAELQNINQQLQADLAECKQAVELLAVNEAHFRSVAQSASDAIIVADNVGNIVLWNLGAQTMFGYKEDEVMGQPLTILMPERYRGAHREGLARYMSTGLKKVIGNTIELYGLRKNGDEFPLELSLSVWKNEEETFFNGIIRDITERKQAETLRDSEKHFRALIENSSDAVALFSAEGTILYGSPATHRILGYSLEEFVGRNAFELIHPDDHAFVLSRLTEVMQEPGAMVNVHAQVLHKNGSWRFLEGVFTNLLAEPAVGAIVNNYRDITGRKQMEQALQKAHDELEARVEQRTAELTRANEQLSALYTLGQIITSPLRLAVVLDVIARSTAQLLETDTGVILLLDETGETLTIKGAYGVSDEAVKRTRDRVGESIAGRVVQTGQPIIANDLPNDPRFYNPAAAQEALLACMSVPLIVGKKIIGTLDVHSRVNRHAFTEAHLQTLKMLASQAAIAIENASLYEEVQRARDELEERVRWRTAELIAANEQLQQEIIERQQAEQARSQLAAIVDSADDAIISKDLDGIIRSWNTGAERLFGYQSDEVIGQSVSLLIPPAHQDEEHAILEKLKRGERIEHYETVRRRKDATLVPVWLTISPVKDSAGAIIGVSKIARDLTERKRVEEAQRFMAEASLLLANSIDYETTLASVAHLAVPHIADWCTVDIVAEDGTLQRLAVAHVDPAKVEWAYKLQRRFPYDPNAPSGVARVLRTGQPDFYPEIPDELLVISAGGNAETFQILRDIGFTSVITVPLLARGHTLGAITLVSAESRRHYGPEDLALAEDLARRAAVAIDTARLYRLAQEEIAERKRAEEKLEQTVVELERSNAEFQQFAYVASHDLQEPLRMIASYTQLLARRYQGQLDADADDFIAYAVDGANRMQRLINDLLAYSRVGTQGKAFQLTESELVLDQALANLQRAVAESQAVVTHDGLPMVLGDETQLMQLFQNLIGNALKFRNSQPPHVHISAERKGNEWLFSVRDNGIGIEPQYAERIFIIFQRLHNKADYPGTGIGLAICKRIVERHGGRIWLESQPSQGTTFYFTLPASERKK